MSEEQRDFSLQRKQLTSLRKQFFIRKKQCPFSGKDALKIDYKDVKLLSRFVSEMGKIIPSRVTGASQKKQRELSIAIKRARSIGLMPYQNT